MVATMSSINLFKPSWDSGYTEETLADIEAWSSDCSDSQCITELKQKIKTIAAVTIISRRTTVLAKPALLIWEFARKAKTGKLYIQND
jgi:hypothetical protein